MATDKQINANRINAKKGGPKTPAGRAAVRFNAFKHGLFAEHPVLLSGEEEETFNFYHEALLDEFQPVGVMEHLLIDEMAHAHWRRQRVVALERGLFDVGRDSLERHFADNYKSIFQSARKHVIADTDAQNQDMLGRYYRYDTRFERSFYKAYKELKAIQDARQAREEAEQEEAEQQETDTAINQTEQSQFHPKSTSRQSETDAEVPEK